MTQLSCYVLCGLFFLASSVALKAAEITLSPIKDAYIRHNPADASWAEFNGGTSTAFLASAWTYSGNLGKHRALIQFDLSAIPAGAAITKAELFLGGRNSSALTGSNECKLSKITYAWGEYTANWGNMSSSYTTDGEVTIPQTTSATEDRTVDITAIAKDWHNGTVNNYGLMMRLVTEAVYRKMDFCSREYTDVAKRPKLTVEYLMFVTQPVDQFGTNGSSVTFSIAVNCSGVVYQWQVYPPGIGWVNAQGNTTSYTLPVSMGMNGFKVRCIASYKGVNLISNEAVLHCLAPPVISSSHLTEPVCINSSVSYSATSSVLYDAYQWEIFSGGTGANWVPFGNSSSSISIEHVNDAMDGYKVRCKGIYQGVELVSNPATLLVHSFPEIERSFEYNGEGQEEEVTILIDKDSEVRSVSANTNYGRTDYIVAHSNSDGTDIVRSYLEIGLGSIPFNAEIIGATLYLFGIGHHLNSTTSLENSYRIQQVAVPWRENTITWNNQPATCTGLGCIPNKYRPATDNPSSVGYTDNDQVDISEFVKYWHSGVTPNNGVCISLQYEKAGGGIRHLQFTSGESTNPYFGKPYVKVKYKVPSKTVCSSAPFAFNISGFDSYSWNPTSGLGCSDCNNLTATIQGEQTYTITGVTNNNGCSCKYAFNLFPCDEGFGELSYEMDAGYYLAYRGCLFFRFHEAYKVPVDEKLDYTIYDVAGSADFSTYLPDIPIEQGDNYGVIDVNFLAPDKHYILEAKNSKGEISYLRFKYVNE